jgi:hypothetical protein
VPIIVSLPNAGHDLVGGLFARGRIGAETASGIVLPANAIAEPDGRAVATVVRNNATARVAVHVTLRDPVTERVLVDGGIKEGDVVLTGTARELSDGTPVRLAGRATEE